MTTIIVAIDGLRATISFPYDADAVTRLKDVVPGWDRRFDPETKHWVIGKAWLPKLTEAMNAGGHTVGDQPPAPPLKPEHYDRGVGGFFGIDDNDDFDTDAFAAAILTSVETRHHGKLLRAFARAIYPDLYPKRKARR